VYNAPNNPNPPTSTTVYTPNPTLTLVFGPQNGGWQLTVSGPATFTVTENIPSMGITQTITYAANPGTTYTYGVANSSNWDTVVLTTNNAPTGVAGPATDFGINVYLNDPNGGINCPDINRQLGTISDGTSNTILMGHAYVQTIAYPSTTAVPSSLQSIFVAGSLATGRTGLGNTAADWLQDGTAMTANQWGSPMPEGGLMAMCDGAVRIFPYSTPADRLPPARRRQPGRIAVKLSGASRPLFQRAVGPHAVKPQRDSLGCVIDAHLAVSRETVKRAAITLSENFSALCEAS
jgi:hypothetical protein